MICSNDSPKFSGPRSCLCSQNFGCTVNDDNLIDLSFGAEKESDCQILCQHQPDCEIYTWYGRIFVFLK